MKKIDSASIILFAFLVSLLGSRTPSAMAQPIFMDPSQNKDPAYAQLDLSNRMNQWNIRQLGFQIVGNARFQKRSKPMSQAQINRLIQNAKKLNRYNSAASITKYKDSGNSIVPARLLQGVALDDINKRLAIGLMQKSLTGYLTTSMHDGFESNDLAWATVYFWI